MAPRRKAPPSASADAGEPLTLPVTTAPPPRFVAPVPDSPVTLEHPIEYAGRTYDIIIRRRPSAGVLGRWFEQFAEGTQIPGEAHRNVPIFVHPDGTLVPDEVIGFLDDDDRQRVFEGTDPFVPVRLAAALELLTQDSPLSAGEPTEPTSSASSAAPAPSSTP